MSLIQNRHHLSSFCLRVMFSFYGWHLEKSLAENLMGKIGTSPRNGRLDFGDDLRFPTLHSFRHLCCSWQESPTMFESWRLKTKHIQI